MTGHPGEHGPLSWREQRALIRLVHREVEGSRGPTGPIIPLTGRPDWEADTACGQRLATSRVTRGGRVTCPDCAAQSGSNERPQ